MSHRRAPREAATAFRAARDLVAPQTGLATIQSAWSKAVGLQFAAVASPVSERAGTLTIEVSDSVWAQELDLMQDTILERLRETLGESAPRALKFRLASDTLS